MNLNVRISPFVFYLISLPALPYHPTDWLSASQPITQKTNTWTPAQGAQSQDPWSILVVRAVSKTTIIQAGNSDSAPPAWGAAELISTNNSTARSYVHDYSHHNYPGGTLTSSMSHVNIASNIAIFNAGITAANGVGKEYVLGEMNSASGEAQIV
jgi:hypothetical protein